jgi:signal transduction histidine kinase/CheY-like chemotaxis protein
MADLLCGEPDENDMVSWTPVTVRTHLGENKEMLAYMLCFDEPEGLEKIIWLVDVTQSRQMERELKTAKDLAESNTKAKSEFLANMSHEIRTPMNAIIGLTHLALRTSLTEQQTEYIETVQQSAHILLRLINDILDFSKIEAGRMVLEYREFSIGSIISEVSAVVNEPIQKKHLELHVEVEENLPSAVMGDSVRLHQVILNLLTNAIKFTEKGVVRLNVEVVESDMLSVEARFSVTDSGIGMTPLQVKGLFQPFSQASASTTRRFGGTGLGLAISKQIVELMHGEISCQSEEGKGTTFAFTARFGIPLEGEVVNVDESTIVRTDALLVGDYPQDQETMKHYIELLGLKVYQSGAALSEFKEFLDTDKIKAVDFIVFDFSDLRKDFIPIYTALQKKRLDYSPLCAITERPDWDSVLNELGIQDSVLTIKKPVVAGDLFNIVAKAAAHKEELIQVKKASESQLLSRNKGDVVVPKSLRGAKILLAEDNKINQMVAKELLRVEGFETTVADNGRIAVELLNEQKFDLVLMDVQMPEMDGYEAARTIRADERFKDLPILAMTANAMAGDKELCLEAGMNDHIAKPIEPKILYNALIKWIRK